MIETMQPAVETTRPQEGALQVEIREPAPRGLARRPLDWVGALPFALCHVAILGALWSGVTLESVVLCLGLLFARTWGVTAGYHRYFSHRTFQTSRAFQLVLAVLAQSSLQKGALWWAAHHRVHHRQSDQPGDVHSPVQRGFWYAHVGWIFDDTEATRWEQVRDLARYPELRWLDRYHLVPVVGYAAALWAAGGVPFLLWGYFVSTVLLWHGTFLVNSLAHVVGRRRYDTGDASRNSLLIALVTLGEGWHNNHHHYQSTANQGWFWWEIDVTYYALRALASLGVVRDLRTPPPAVRDGSRCPPETARGAVREGA
jgi:stearoyl-CoA desaturase (delta-9 desaturase)